MKTSNRHEPGRQPPTAPTEAAPSPRPVADPAPTMPMDPGGVAAPPTVGTEKPPARFGRYEIRGELGRGGMGVVYHGFDPALQREVAIKVIQLLPGSREKQMQRFEREAKSAARLRHGGIIAVYEFGEEQGRPYIVMDHVRGQVMVDWLRQEHSIEEVAGVVRDIARALEYAHGHGVIHRDVKPSNVVIDPEGRPHLMDFGLARDVNASEDLTATGQMLGTPAYMAPEQAGQGGHPVGPVTDVYGLGALLYHGLAGRPPFVGANMADLMRLVLFEAAPPIRAGKPEVPAPIEAVALQCLEKDPAQRYPSARALAADLERFLEGRLHKVRRRTRPAVATQGAPDEGGAPARDSVRRTTTARASFRPRPSQVVMLAGVFVAGILLGLILDEPETVEVVREVAAPAPVAEPSEQPAAAEEPPATEPPPFVEPRPAAPAGPIGRAKLRAFHAAVLTFDGSKSPISGPLALYRELGIGEDLERLGRTVAAEEPRLAAELWLWAALDRAVLGAARACARALDRSEAAMVWGIEAEERTRLRALRGIVELVARVVGAAFEGDAREAVALLDPASWGAGKGHVSALLDERTRQLLAGVVQARRLLPELVIARQIRGFLASPERTRQSIREIASGLRELAAPVAPELRARAERVADEVQADLEAVLSRGVVRLAGDDGELTYGLGAQPLELWTIDARGASYSERVLVARERLARYLEGDIRLTLPDLARFARVEVDLRGLGQPVLGLELRRGDAAASFAAGFGKTGWRPASLPKSFFQTTLLTRNAQAPTQPRPLAVGLKWTKKGELAVFVDGLQQSVWTDGNPEQPLELRLFPGPGVVVSEVRLAVAGR